MIIKRLKILGVDLNRNFDVEFGGVGTSKSPCVDTYCGSKAFSETESKAVSDFVTKHKDTIKIFISLHSYSQLWMHPYVRQCQLLISLKLTKTILP